MPQSNSGYTDEEIEDIKNSNNPLREGTTYFHSKDFNFSETAPSIKDADRFGGVKEEK